MGYNVGIGMTTLTLQIDDEDLLERAHRLAAARRMTLPELIERLLRVMVESPPRPEELPPLTRRAHGMLPPMTDSEVEQILNDERMRKHESS